uniref:PDE1 N-terminal domain-containing protein n=1 Tax=Anopheles atroparvus TaxID=41427 RepID=A0A182J747_ANOAO
MLCDTFSKPVVTDRRLADEDDELSEVQPDAVPPEVREWLASTFTRQLATTRKKSDEKPKFRSVAHAIRAGIFVDRIYRRVSSTALMQFPPEVVRVLKVVSERYRVHTVRLRVGPGPSAGGIFLLLLLLPANTSSSASAGSSCSTTRGQ